MTSADSVVRSPSRVHHYTQLTFRDPRHVVHVTQKDGSVVARLHDTSGWNIRRSLFCNEDCEQCRQKRKKVLI